jgi:glycosyltransferase involved in cell wall biosynthesis
VTARPTERLRVAALMDTTIVSGPGRQLAGLATALRDEGIDLRVVLFERAGSPPSAYREFLAHHGVDHVVVPFRGRVDRSLPGAVRRELEAWRPHVVQTHSYRPTAIAWLLRRLGAAWPWIGFFHGTTNEDFKVRVYHWVDRKLLPSADRIVVMSRTQRQRFAHARDRVMQIYNAVLPSPATPASAETGAPVARIGGVPRPRVGVVGRLSHEKGVDVMLHAFANVRRRGVPASLVVAGEGPERAALEALSRELGVHDATHFVGQLLPVEPLYPLLDLLVIPSRSEGLPNVLLEALRADVPVVSTRVGAVPEVLDGTRAGRIVPVEDPAALADAIVAALAEPPNVARADRAAVVDRFSLASRVRAHVDLYRELAGAVG